MDELSKQLFGERNVAFSYEAGREALVRAAEKRLFDRSLSSQEYVEIVAALDGAMVTVDYDSSDDVIVVATTHPYYQEEQVRTIGIVAGKKTIDNILFGVARPPAPQGVGARIAARQVEMAQRMGFDEIVLQAGGVREMRSTAIMCGPGWGIIGTLLICGRNLTPQVSSVFTTPTR